MLLVILHHLLNVSLQLANKRGLKKTKKKLHGLSPRANYTDRANAACRLSDCQLLRIEGKGDSNRNKKGVKYRVPKK
jgi:hypothetical protein